MNTAIVILSPASLNLARKLLGSRPGATIFGPSCVVEACRKPDPPSLQKTFATDEPGVRGWVGPLRLAFPEIWADHEAIIAVMIGIVVRLVGPLALDKRRDPAVVAVDDAGRFAIAVLGGHAAGANDLVRDVASILGALPVITTASNAHRLPAVDQIGKRQGWRIEHEENLTRVAAAVVRREPVAVYQDCGDRDWWREFGTWPMNLFRITSWDEAGNLNPSAILAITDRLVPDDVPADRLIVYRPKTLVAGIGCKRGTSPEIIGDHVAEVFSRYGLAIASLATVATVSLKADEPGLIRFAQDRGVPLVAYLPEELEFQPGMERPSERVRAKIGIPGVAEPAALRASGATRLVVPKQKGPGVTLAVCRKAVD